MQIQKEFSAFWNSLC